MRIARQDYRKLAVPAAVALAFALLGAGCVLVAEYSLARANAGREAAKVQRQQAQKRVEQVAEEEKEIRQNLVHYQQMVERGMVGQENRLDLIDSIAKIKKDRKLFEIKYNIEPQKPLEYPGIAAAGKLDFVASRMRLDMLLLHEEDLLNFLGDLDRVGKSHVSVRDCTLTRLDRGAASAQSNAPRLRSECQIDLIVLRQVQS
jgi:hypothetical protein